MPNYLLRATNGRRRATIAVALTLLLGAAGAGCSSTSTTPSTAPTSASSPTSSTPVTPSGSPSASKSAVGDPCAKFDHPLDPIKDGAEGTLGTGGVEATGCDEGQSPAFKVTSADWSFGFAYTCSGTFGPDGMRDSLLVTPYNVGTSTALEVTHLEGAWGSGAALAGDGSPAPAGTYRLKVTRAVPDDNHCKWHLAVRAATPA